MAVTTATIQPDAPYERVGVPTLGFRNYWYPVLPARRLGRRPRAITIMGEQIVLFRDGGKIHALEDRCPHRGVRLSAGACKFPGSGTISCAYHGWTFRGGDGSLAAALMEGPNAPIERKIRVQPYAVTERAGLIWLFVGDMDAVPLEDDLPDYLADRAQWHVISNWRSYRCNWRVLMDNLSHDQHAPFLHRNSPELLFQPIFKHATRNATVELADGKGIGHLARDGISAADYPGLGHFPPPQENWYRLLRPTGRGKEVDPQSSPAAVKYGIQHRHMNKLPTIALIGRPSGDFFTCRWVVPVDADNSVLLNFNLYRRRGALRTLADRLQWLFWKGWAHDWLFSDQDKAIVETITPGPELLSRTDVGVVAWRRFALRNARRPAAAARQAGD